MSTLGLSVDSSTSSYNEVRSDVETVKVKACIKDLLKSRIFLGRYLERRLISQDIGYRDIVLLSAAEVDLKKDLLQALKDLRSTFGNQMCIGIFDAEDLGVNLEGLCLSTEIDNQPFGPFWFQIKSIKFRSNEIVISLRCLRYISESYLEIEPMLTGKRETRLNTKKSNKEDIKFESNVESLSDTYNEIVSTLRSAMTISNVKELIKFIFAFIIAIFTGSTTFVNFLGNFVLSLVRETSILIKNSTPMFLGLLDFFSKIIGGFYILLAMFFKPSSPPPSKRSISYKNHHDSNYDYRQFD